jgi:competence protein ComEC
MIQIIKKNIENHNEFWRLHPALLTGITFLIGTASSLFSLPIWGAFYFLYLLLLKKKTEIALLLLGGIYPLFFYSNPPDSVSKGYFSITSVQTYQSPFQKGLSYQGRLYVDGKSLPCTVRCLDKHPPKANCDYILTGKGKRTSKYHYFFKAKKWDPVKNTYNYAQYRYELKEKFLKFLHSKLHRNKTAIFLGSLVTAHLEDRLLRYEFSKIGLQHILAVSGFHFALLIAFCSYFLSFFFSYKVKNCVLLTVIIGYFLFVGNLPATQRSVVMAALYLIAKLIGRNTTGLNLLGVAILVELIADPLISSSLGFQLSFLSCLGILLFPPLFQAPLLRMFPKYDYKKFSLFSKHCYLLSLYMRKSLTISLSVNLAIFPLLLYHFHEFPLLSLIYNLFYPPLVSLVLFLLLVALLMQQLFSPIATPIFFLTDFLTSQILDIAAYPPLALDYSILCSKLVPWAIPIYLFALFCLTNRRHLRYDFVV